MVWGKKTSYTRSAEDLPYTVCGGGASGEAQRVFGTPSGAILPCRAPLGLRGGERGGWKCLAIVLFGLEVPSNRPFRAERPFWPERAARRPPRRRPEEAARAQSACMGSLEKPFWGEGE